MAVASPRIRFYQSPHLKLDGLISRGVFATIPTSVANFIRIFGFRFADTIKDKGTPDAFNRLLKPFHIRKLSLVPSAPVDKPPFIADRIRRP